MGSNHFLKQNGNAVEYIECTQWSGRIREDLQQCFKDIPITTPTGAGFIRASTRLFVKTSAPKPCSSHFALKVHTKEDVWIELNPKARSIPTPKKLPDLKPETEHHEDMSEGGLYSDSELRSWRQHLQVGDNHEAISRTISYGICVHEGECNPAPATPTFDLQQLSPTAWGLTSWRGWARAHALIISLIVLAIEGTRFIVFAFLLLQTSMTHGGRAAQAILYAVCCDALRQLEKVTRHSRPTSRGDQV